MAGEPAPKVVVIGAGPGGYPAAFLAADLGCQVTLIDPEARPGGVCLYRGCIPSKALLHVARLLEESRQAAEWGVTFGKPKIDLARLRAWKDRQVVAKMTGGLGQLTQARKLTYLRGRARFLDGRKVSVLEEGESVDRRLSFDYAVVATGSRPVVPPALALESERVMDSTAALELRDVPKTLLVVGGGYIGLELGSVYAALGSRVTVVEMLDRLLPGVDRDLVRPLAGRMEGLCEAVRLQTRVVTMTEQKTGMRVTLKGPDLPKSQQTFEKVLVAVGRRPNSEELGLEQTRAAVDGNGFITVDAQRRTGEPSIFAVGDVAGEPMLAHKATHEGRVAAAVIAGRPAAYAPATVPAVVFTDPEIAWCGLTEAQAKEEGITVQVARFPWAASGRATTLGRSDGLTKLVIAPRTERVLGVGIVGPGAGELISEGVLAVEMAATAADVAESIHPHPTLSETLMEAAEAFYGHPTHTFQKKR